MFGENQTIIPIEVEQEMKKSFLAYSMAVIVGRALPDVRDGFKPVHRRIIYTMFENGLYPNKPYRKCADTVGSVLGRYHPHGDASVYDAMVRLAQGFSLRYPLIDGHGNFGSIDGDPPAAYRYTESRLGKLALQMVQDIDCDTVDFCSNYDDRLKEPVVLPSRFPNLLVNGSVGIAVGMATNIPPHNLGEVVDAINLLIENPDASLDELMTCIKGPDFPTGATIMGRAGIRAAYATGRGKIIVRAKTDIEEHGNHQQIVVTEIPYMVNKARMIEGIADLVKDKRIEGISTIRDESSKRGGLRVVLELKRDANPQVVLNKLYSYSQLQESFGIILLALVNGEPKTLTLKEMITQYIDFQCDVIRRRTEFRLKKAKEREHILEGLKIALDFIDEVVAILKAAKSVPEGRNALMERFGLDEIQAGAIVDMRLGQLTGLEKSKILDELAALCEKIAEYEDILSDHQKILGIVKSEINEIREKYSDDRRTEIVSVSGEVDIEDLIPVGDCIITMTHYGYIKRMATEVYKSQRRGGRGVSGMTRREEDFAERVFVCSTHDYIAFFTNKGRIYRLKGYEIPEVSKQSRGTNIVNLLPLESDEKVTSMIRLENFDAEGAYLAMITKNGIIKRTRLNEYRNIRKGGLIAIDLDEGDQLGWVLLTDGERDLYIATHNGLGIRINENDARPLSRSARGVKAITLREGDEVVGATLITEGETILTVTENGKGRRTENSEYRLQNRGGFGSINYRVNEEKGAVAGVKSVSEDEDILLISDDGILIRTRVSEINTQSRYGSGVNVMRLNEGAKLVTFATTPAEEAADETEATEGESADEQTQPISDAEQGGDEGVTNE
ncbi:MAG: DNA gyrase subunit A [Ruminococcaceae bacterium]|nr:DNA gyrase subunit A [Oscillospiraceae bacterium]